MSEKIYKTAPLPFQGQKRRFISTFASTLRELKQEKDVKIIIDLFGGSGLLSHTAKKIFPECRIIYNDFDDYSGRLRNVHRTNKLLSDIRAILGNYPKDKRIELEYKNKIIARIEKEEQSGCVDYITLSSSLLFSAKYVVCMDDLKNETFYNNVKASDYDFNPNEYLEGLEIISCDYKVLYEKYKDIPGVLFLVDPPYLSTDTSTYHSNKYWKLKDYLDVLNVLIGTNYIFFTSNKSSLVDLCEWFANNKHIGNPFEGSVLNTQNVTLNKTASYTDMMLFKHRKE
ncbi:MAG: DNA adenine methylase [Dysgonomonas sp.]|nr:DNA adenine methylase [Dysgonomonas sp.]